ncbi:MAG: HYR domain-containing protein [Saprospiraceae bacterium]|nr:HYR domain-containing protein [Saprospiraceae bacterium]
MMKSQRFFYCTFFTFLLSVMGSAQVSVTVTGSGNTTPNLMASYASLNDALTDLNAISAMSGPVELSCASGSETAPSTTGFTLGSASLNPLLSSTNTITIIGTGVVTLNATVGITTPVSVGPDGIFKIVGADWVTISNITFTDGNVTNPATMEYGLALFKLGEGDGAQNNTIQNCTFNMQRINFATGIAPMVEGSVGILMINSTATFATTPLTPVSAAGTNSYNKFYGNTTNGGNYGIVLSGYAAPTPFTLGDTNNDIGGSSPATGNSILNYGGGVAANNASAGIRANNQWGLNIAYNTVVNNNGGGADHPSTLRGIYAQAGTSANATINFNTVTIKGAGTTSQLTGIDVGIGSTAASNTVTVENNTVQNCTYATATSGTFRAIAVSSNPTTLNVSSNTVSANTMAGTGQFDGIVMSSTPATLNCNFNTVDGNMKTGTGTFHGIYSSGSSTSLTAIFQGNTITNNQIQASSGTLYCMRGATSLYTVRDNNINTNSIPATSLTSSSFIYGYYNIGSPTSENIFNNDIYDLSIGGSGTSTSSVIYGITISTSSSSVKNIYNNRIRNLQYLNSSTGSATIIGINQSLALTANIYANKIYDLIATNGASSLVRGIQISSGTTLNVYNNLIGNLQASASTSGDALRGINITSSTASSNLNISYNTIYLYGTSSGTNFGSQGIFHTFNTTGTTATLNMRNNIISNLSTSTGTGLTVAFRRSAATNLNNYGTVSNNNLFYAGAPSATNLIYYDGTNSDQTIAAFKSRVTPRESASVSELPDFISTTGADADFLHINTGTSSQIESGGIAIAGITDDVDGDIRNATSPDIGADEFDGMGVDLTPPLISYGLLAHTSCIENKTLSGVIITDASNINLTAGTRPRMYFKKTNQANTYNDNTNATNGWKYVEASGMGNSPFSFTTDFSLLFGGSGVAVGDTIQYFVVAQDLAATPNVGINAGTFASLPSDVNLTGAQFPIGGTLNKFIFIPAGLSGFKTVGAAGDYPTLTGAGGLFEAINNAGMSAAITVDIVDATINETGAIALNNIIYTGCIVSQYPLTIKPQTTATLTGSVSSGALIKLNGADNVTIDGSNSGGTDRSLTITNTATSAPTAVSMVSLGAGAGANNNTLKNCNISTGIATSIGYGISVGGNTPGTGGDDNDNTTIQNNSISLAPVGIYAIGTMTGTNENLNIVANEITYNGTLASLGIRVGYASNSLVSQNTVSEQTTATQAPTGISLETGFINSSVTKNNITKALTTSTSGYGGRGITVGTGTASSNLTIANNFISGVNGSNWTTFGNSSAMGIGIGMVGNSSTITTVAGGINIYHNSVNMYGNYVGTSTGANKITAALYVGSGATSLDIRNNIFVNSLNNPNAVATAYAIYSAAANTAFTAIDFNDYYVSGAQGVLGYIGSNRTDLAGIIAGFGQNVSSVSADPLFVSDSDLHISTSQISMLDNIGTPIAAVTTDIDNDPRNVSTPDLGGDEFTVPVCSGIPDPGNTLASSITVCVGSSVNLSLQNSIVGLGVSYQWYDSNGQISGATNPTFTTPAFVVSETYYCEVTCSYSGETGSSNPVAISVVAPPNGGIATGPATGFTNTNLLFETTGSNGNLQWQSATSLAGTYTNISGATTASNNIQFVGGGTFFVKVKASIDGCPDAFSNIISTLITLANDNVCNALPLSLGGNGPFSNVGATGETDEVVPPGTTCRSQTTWCNNTGAINSVWFSFTPAVSGKYDFTLNLTTFDSQFALYAADECSPFTGFTLLAANDDNTVPGTGVWSQLNPVCLTEGVTYYLLVDGYNANTASGWGIQITKSPNVGPSISACPSNFTVCGTNVAFFTPPTGSDDCGSVDISSNYAPGDEFPSGLTTVTYVATDAEGATASCSFEVKVSPEMEFNAIANQPVCATYTGSVDLELAGGIAPYTYNGGNPPTTNLSPGAYTYFVTDDYGCTAEATAYIEAPANPCIPPVIVCGNIINVYANPGNLIFNGPGTADVYLIPAVELDGGTVSLLPGTLTRQVKRTLTNVAFNWTTNGACVDATPNGVYNNNDKGIVYKNCLPVTPADFNVVRNFDMSATDFFGTSTCSGRYRVIFGYPPGGTQTVNSEETEAYTRTLDEETDFQVFPNPGTNQVFISTTMKEGEVYSLSILDAFGKEVKRFDQIENGFMSIETTDLVPGAYTMMLRGGETIKTLKWLKME